MKSKNLELAAAVASAIDELGLSALARLYLLFRSTTRSLRETLKCVIVPGLYALQRIARDGAKETAAVGVVLYKNVSDQGDVVNNTAICRRVYRPSATDSPFRRFSVFTMEDGGEYHVVDVQTDMLYDPVQLERYYVYNGALTITFERHATVRCTLNQKTITYSSTEISL